MVFEMTEHLKIISVPRKFLVQVGCLKYFLYNFLAQATTCVFLWFPRFASLLYSVIHNIPPPQRGITICKARVLLSRDFIA